MNELQVFNLNASRSQGQTSYNKRTFPVSLRGAVFFFVGMLMGYVFIGF